MGCKAIQHTVYITTFDLRLKAMGSINVLGYCWVIINLENAYEIQLGIQFAQNLVKFASSTFEKSSLVTITVVKFGLKLYTVLLTVYCSWPSKYSLVRKQTYQLIL